MYWELWLSQVTGPGHRKDMHSLLLVNKGGIGSVSCVVCRVSWCRGKFKYGLKR